MTDLDALEKLAWEAAALDHNETDRWYTADELMADYVSAKEAVWYPKNARLMAAASPDVVLRLVAVARAAQSAAVLLERCGPHLQGVEQECCGHYQPDYGGEYMGQREIVPVCCGQAMDLSDHVANELRVLGEALAGLKAKEPT